MKDWMPEVGSVSRSAMLQVMVARNSEKKEAHFGRLN